LIEQAFSFVQDLLAARTKHVLLCYFVVLLSALGLDDVLFEPLADSDGLFQVLVTELGLAEARELPGRGDSITDLAAVHRLSGEIVQMRSHIFEIHALVQLRQAVDELGPDLGATLGGEIVVVQSKLDARLESLIECAYSIARED
jgi:hypothetical protein